MSARLETARDMTRLARVSRVSSALALSLLCARPPAAAQEPAPPAKPRDPPGTHLVELVGFGAEVGGSPALFAAKLGVGSMRGGERPTGRWMAWLEADGTDWFRPAHPADANRVDRILWIWSHAEVSQLLARRAELFGWVRAGPTLGRYAAGGGADALLFPGVAAGAGLEWRAIRLGVTWYGQWTSATVRRANDTASPDVRMAPMVLVTAGLELTTPLRR
jgi:hypothetical protein